MVYRHYETTVTTPGIGSNTLKPGFPRPKSDQRTEKAAKALNEAGYSIELSNMFVAVAEPREVVDETFSKFHYNSYSGWSSRVQTRPKTGRYSQKRALAELGSAIKTEVTVTCPDGENCTFTVVQMGPAGKICRNRLIPVDIMEFILHTLEEWAYNPNYEGHTKTVADRVLAVMQSSW